MRSLQQITCSIAVSRDSGFDKETHCGKVKIRTESNRGKKCMFDCNVTKIDVRQSDYTFADRDKLYEATNQRFGRQFNVPTHIELLVCSFLRFIKSKGKLDGCARKRTIMIFLYWLQKFGRLITARLAWQKDPGHLFVVKFYGRVNTIKVMSNQSVNLLGSQMRSNKRTFLNTRFQDRSIYN